MNIQEDKKRIQKLVQIMKEVNDAEKSINDGLDRVYQRLNKIEQEIWKYKYEMGLQIGPVKKN